ncbi:cellulase family glycosylhydrolase [Paenibacillus pinistramenti]|uniref:cellulase family glycosylhydrolase n=1 Tax=Paenibacillus pinistramenti TaxID=1768003 RepID=UPI001107FD15|nr:cellulase family glycosylhydrolase [Paenibacillus pinistramenti]
MKHRSAKSLFSFTLISVLLLSMFASGASAAGAELTASSAKTKTNALQSYVDSMQPGWNLGNTLDATGADETTWGNPKVTKQLIQQIKKQGFNSIRIPVTWGQHMGSAPDYTIDPAYLDRVQEVVNWALDAHLYVLINVHHDSWQWVSYMESKHDEVLAQYNAAWTQIADRFKNTSDKLLFESINEPRFTDGGTTDTAKMFDMLAELNTSFHQIVRASGGKNTTRPLVLPSLGSSPTQENMDELYSTITSLNDPNLIATVHYYGFWPFSVNIAGYTTFEQDTQNDITTTFDNVYNTFTAKGIPVILGEYGLLGFDKNTNVIEQGEKLKFFNFLLNKLKDKHITAMLWDNGQHFGRTTFKWSDPSLYHMIMDTVNGAAATASSDQIFIKQGQQVKDASLQLTLNGTKFDSISVNGKKLKKNQDYTLTDGGLLTLKANTLKSLTASGKTGVNAVLTLSFNKGPEWKVNVIVYKTPQLQSASGTTDSFSIPTAFNGDRLATMEAVYADGSFAGPQNWTAYKEFGNTFNPNYDNGTIDLLPAFFNEVKDGDVTLKFHFWSGEIVTYTITKNGTAVTGQAN